MRDSDGIHTDLSLASVPWTGQDAAVGEADMVLRQGKFRIKEGSNLFVVEV